MGPTRDSWCTMLASAAPRLRLAVRPMSRALSYANPQSMAMAARWEKWPVRKANTIFNVVPQGSQYVVERLGKFNRAEKAGWFIGIPMVDQITYIVDMREKAIEITPQPAITRDNISLDISGNVFVQFVDAERAAYGSENPLYAVVQAAQSAMRAAIGSMELDDILHARQKLNDTVRESLEQAAEPWGMTVKRYEITEIMPDPEIQRAMDKQGVAERERRELVKGAEGQKAAEILQSEGIKMRLQNESEGDLIKVRNEAQAMKERQTLEAEGFAQAILTKAKAQAEAIHMVAAAMKDGEGKMAAQMTIAEKYVEMYGEMGSKSNTMVFSDKPGDVNALMAQAAAVLGNTFKGLDLEQKSLPPSK